MFIIFGNILLDIFSIDFVTLKNKIQIYSWFITNVNNQICHIN